MRPHFNFVARPAEGMAVFIEGNVIRGVFGRLCPAVDVPVFQQLISGDVVMGGIKADIFWGKAKTVAAKVVYGKEEIFTVMAFGIRKFQENGEFGLKPVISAAEHIESVTEIPVFVVTVPSPFCIRSGIMAATGVPVGAGKSAGGKMLAVRGGMRDQCSAIAGEGKVLRINEAEADGREDVEEEKDPLESCFGIIRGRHAVHDTGNDVFCGDRGGVIGLNQFAVRADHLFGFLPVFASREEGGTGISIPWPEPEAVHKVIVGAKWRKFFQGRAPNEKGKGNRVWKNLCNPRGKACPGLRPVEEQDEKNEGAQDLGLVFGGPAGA